VSCADPQPTPELQIVTLGRGPGNAHFKHTAQVVLMYTGSRELPVKSHSTNEKTGARKLNNVSKQNHKVWEADEKVISVTQIHSGTLTCSFS